MVTHDDERGMITGLPRSVVDEVRRTGKLPRGAKVGKLAGPEPL